MQVDGDLIRPVCDRNLAGEFEDVHGVGNVEYANLRIAEAGDLESGTSRCKRAQPIGVSRVSMGIVELDGFDDADVVLALERGKGNRIMPLEKQRRFDR